MKLSQLRINAHVFLETTSYTWLADGCQDAWVTTWIPDSMNLIFSTSSTHAYQGAHTAVVVARNKPWKFSCLLGTYSELSKKYMVFVAK